jgi:uncharacterized iron-regulated protein
MLRLAAIAVFASLAVACAAPTAGTQESFDTTALPFEGDGFTHARVLRLEDGAWIEASALVDALASSDAVFFGEQHQTAPVQALERWVFAQLEPRMPKLSLAMEHFQADEQPVIDRYFSGAIDQATFEAQAQVWPGYETYWRGLVEDARARKRPLVGLNVPKEVLSGVYAAFPSWPLDVFDAIPADAASSQWLPNRPVTRWDPTYQGWFETSYDYSSHGKDWGLSYEDALHYFTDLAVIRDETMALWTTRALANGPVFVVAGDWHVQTRLAVPDRVAHAAPEKKIATITTIPHGRVDEIRTFQHAGRRAADYVITYE